MIALPLEKLIVTAAAFFRICPANGGTVFINRAASFSRMKKLASRLENVVFAMPQDSAITFDLLGKFLFGLFPTQSKPFRQSLDIALGHDNPIVGAAITRAFCAIVKDRQGSFYFRRFSG